MNDDAPARMCILSLLLFPFRIYGYEADTRMTKKVYIHLYVYANVYSFYSIPSSSPDHL